MDHFLGFQLRKVPSMRERALLAEVRGELIESVFAEVIFISDKVYYLSDVIDY